MLWRVRTNLPDRPGALAALAERCGLADINILALQIFPAVSAVTDELVLRAPDTWDADRLAGLVTEAGGTEVHVLPSTEAALTDQPTRYVQAARAVVAAPASFPEVVGRLFDASGSGDLMELTVGDVQVQLRRDTPFTATEHARGAAMAALVTEVLARTPTREVRAPADGSPTYAVAGDAVSAVVDGVVVGTATLAPAAEGAVPVELEVDRDWRRRGIGTRLLLDAGRLAQERGAEELVLVTGADNPAVLPLVLSAGLRGRIRMAGDELTVRVPVRVLRPLRA